MTQTTQPGSLAVLNEPQKDLPVEQPITEETIKELCSLAGYLNELQEELEWMVKACNSLNDARTNYLQAAQKATQKLEDLIQIQSAEEEK